VPSGCPSSLYVAKVERSRVGDGKRQTAGAAALVPAAEAVEAGTPKLELVAEPDHDGGSSCSVHTAAAAVAFAAVLIWGAIGTPISVNSRPFIRQVT
jgi:hypothetical protein